MNVQDRAVDRLLTAIRTATGNPHIDWAAPPHPLTGGFWAQMWRVRLAGHAPLVGDLVARVMPDPAIAARETAVQTYLASTGYPTTHVHLAAPPGPDLDHAWMLMDHAPGGPLLADLSGPTDHLHQHRPTTGASVICHGDLHPFNILTHPDGDTVLDWSATLIADPAYDIAFTQLLLANPPLTAPAPLRPAIRLAGRALAHRFTTTYTRDAPTPPDPRQLHWFTQLQALRILIEVAGWHANDELDAHPGHPFFALSPVATDLLTEHTGLDIDGP